MAGIGLKNLRMQVAEALAVQILDGTYQPGQTMPTEPELMQLTGVSRTTLRSAIQALEAKGLIEVGPSKGTRVQPRANWNLMDSEVIGWRLQLGVSADLVREIYEMRECFEPRASLFAAERGTAEDLQRIAARFDELNANRGGDEARATEADVAFHLAILFSCGNDYIASFATMMTAMLRVSFDIARRRRALSQDDIDQHRAVADAIIARDGERAEAATRQLLVSSKRVQMDAALELERATRVSRAMALNRPR